MVWPTDSFEQPVPLFKRLGGRFFPKNSPFQRRVEKVGLSGIEELKARISQRPKPILERFGRPDVVAIETDVFGDREKPGAERAAKLILVYYVPPQMLSRWHPSMDTEAEAIQSSPRFFPVSVIGLTKTAALEFAKQGVRVNSVSPGPIQTEMFDRSFGEGETDVKKTIATQTPAGRIGTPEEIASAVLWLSSPGAAFTTGQDIIVDGGYTAQ